MKKLAICGASNAMMKKGYGQLLKNLMPGEVDIYAYAGNSTSEAIHFLLDQPILDSYEFVLLDFNLSSSNLINVGVFTDNYFISHIRFIIDLFSLSESTPIFLILPDLNFDIIKSKSYFLRGMAKIYNFDIIDIEDIFKKFSRDELIDEADPAHFIYDKQKIIAAKIIAQIDTRKKTIANNENDKILFSLYGIKELKKYFDNYSISTSIGTIDVFKLHISESLCMPPHLNICGISYYSGDIVPYLNIYNSSVSISKNLNCVWNNYFCYRDIGYTLEQGLSGAILRPTYSVSRTLHERTAHEKIITNENMGDTLTISNILLCNVPPNIFGLHYIIKNRAVFNNELKKLHAIASIYDLSNTNK